MATMKTNPPSPKPPEQAAPFPPREKMPFHECYILIEVDDDGEEHASFHASPAARDKATLDAIWFGGPDESHKDEAEHYLAELREKGFLSFEGDPPLRWRTMTDYVKEEHASLIRAARAEGARELALHIEDMASDRTTEVIWKKVHAMDAAAREEAPKEEK